MTSKGKWISPFEIMGISGHPNTAKNADSGQRYLGIPGIFDNEKAFISRLFGLKHLSQFL